MAKWCTVTVTDSEGRRYSVDVLAESSFDAAHLYVTHVAGNPACGLPVPSVETQFEVVASGRIHQVSGASAERLDREAALGTERAARDAVPAAANDLGVAATLLNSMSMPDIVVERVAGTFLFSGESDGGREWLAGRALSTGMLRSGRFLEVLGPQAAKDLADLAAADGLEVRR